MKKTSQLRVPVIQSVEHDLQTNTDPDKNPGPELEPDPDLYGTWVLLPSTRAEITLPSVERERLIFVASWIMKTIRMIFAMDG